MTSDTYPATVSRSVGRRHSSVVREHQAGYHAADGPGEPAAGRPEVAGATSAGRDTDGERGPGSDAGPPLGVPVLAEIPELAGPLQAFARADALLVQGVLGLAALLEADRDRTAETTGVGVEHWLALTTDAPRLERRTWLRAARLLLRLPRLRSQVHAGRVSAGQIRALTIALRRTPAAIDRPLDDWLADAAVELHRLQADPDVLVEQARQALVELTDHTEVVESDANRARHLHLQPRLDGSGGTFSGEEDAYGFAILEAATRPRPDQTEVDVGRARADNLQALLHGIDPTRSDGGRGHEGCSAHTSCADPGCGGARSGDDAVPATHQRGTPAVPDGGEGDDPVTHRSWAHAIADAERSDAAFQQQLADLPDLAERIAAYANAGGPAPPKLLIRAELSALLEHGRIPATVLTTLAGGQLRVTSAAARALVGAHGADLRLTIVDHGQVVGVGRATRRPPGWLTDAVHAVHDHCTGPLCDRSAQSADIDHAAAWHPDGDQRAGGTTDLDNLGPLCPHPNRNRPATGWRPHQTDTSGIRTWTHPRTGLTTTSVPATWRPPAQHGPGPPDDTGPPDGTGPRGATPSRPPDPSEPPPEPDDLPF